MPQERSILQNQELQNQIVQGQLMPIGIDNILSDYVSSKLDSMRPVECRSTPIRLVCDLSDWFCFVLFCFTMPKVKGQ